MPRRFVAERRHDPYYRAAQREHLRSRAAFKLLYLNERFHLLRAGARVLDLGAAPGGWSLVAAEAVGPTGRVVAVDLRPVEPADGVRVVRGRVGDPDLARRLVDAPFHLVLSDLSPRISGAYATDHARSIDLVRSAARLAAEVLAPGGAFVAKVFDGELVGPLEEELAGVYGSVRRTKPPASREASSEIYLVARGFGAAPPAPSAAGRGGRGSAI